MSPLNISLTDLIERLDADLPEATALARITEAQLRARTLSDLGDQLVGHYVGKAKQAGASWSEIGDAIGVSKQGRPQPSTPRPAGRAAGPGLRDAGGSGRIGAACPRGDRGRDAAGREEGAARSHRVRGREQGGH